MEELLRFKRRDFLARLAAAGTLALVSGPGHGQQVFKEIHALEQHIDELVPDSGLGCRLRDCVLYSVTFTPSPGPVTCDDLEALLDEHAAGSGTVKPADPDRAGCGTVALYNGTVTRIGFLQRATRFA